MVSTLKISIATLKLHHLKRLLEHLAWTSTDLTPWDQSSVNSVIWRLAVTHFWHHSILGSFSYFSLSHQCMAAWRSARVDRDLRRQGRDVAFIHRRLRCCLFFITNSVYSFQIKRKGTDVRMLDHRQRRHSSMKHLILRSGFAALTRFNMLQNA